MTQEERQLLLIDLCGRLPYTFTYCYCNAPLAEGRPIILTPVVISNLMNATNDMVLKPYLRPMSSMTEEEKIELCTIAYAPDEMKTIDEKLYVIQTNAKNATNFYNEHHLDYRGLIEKGLALEAPKDMYNIKIQSYE